MERLKEAVLRHARNHPEGVPLTAKGFLHLGSRAAVDQTLSRLARSGDLLRAGRGLYVLPVEGRFGSRAPSLQKTAEALAEQLGERIANSGAVATNVLGLTTQVPVTPVFLTSGPSRTLKLGRPGSQIAPFAAVAACTTRPPGRRGGPGARLAGAGKDGPGDREAPALAERRRTPGAGWCHRADARMAGRTGEPARPWLSTIRTSGPAIVSRCWNSAASASGRSGDVIAEEDIRTLTGLGRHGFVPPIGAPLVFKGDTSPSKAFGPSAVFPRMSA